MQPDEDSEAWDWKESLIRVGNIGYKGIIRPQYIKPHLIVSDSGWKKA